MHDISTDLEKDILRLAEKNKNEKVMRYLLSDSQQDEMTKTYKVSPELNITVQVQHCQILFQHIKDIDIDKVAIKKVYEFLDYLLTNNLISGHAGFRKLPLLGKCLDTRVSVYPDGKEAYFGRELTNPADWKSTTYTKRNIIMAYVFPSLAFVNSLDDQSKENVFIQFAKRIKGHTSFEALNEGELSATILEADAIGAE